MDQDISMKAGVYQSTLASFEEIISDNLSSSFFSPRLCVSARKSPH